MPFPSPHTVRPLTRGRLQRLAGVISGFSGPRPAPSPSMRLRGYSPVLPHDLGYSNR